MTTPSVPYRIESTTVRESKVNKQIIKTSETTMYDINNVSEWPDAGMNVTHKVYEPMVAIIIICPQEYYGAMATIIKDRRGIDLQMSYLDDGNVNISATVPWQEVVVDMNDAIQNNSSGYASFNYEEAGYAPSKLVKVDIAINGDVCDPLSFVSHHSTAEVSGRKIALKLKKEIARQNFEIIIQAKVNSKVLARERIAPYRKDVLTKGGKTVGGGDITRKKKLLEKQKKGKKRAKMVGKVEIGQEAFFSVMSR
jgi:GTP-binding protein LepA